MTFAINSEPLSERMYSGAPWAWIAFWSQASTSSERRAPPGDN